MRDISLWEGQLMHAVCLIALSFLVWCGWRLCGEPFSALYWFAFLVPVVHQVFVWLAWRLELKSSLVSKTIGFQAFLVVFIVLFLLRFISLTLLGWADQGSIGIPKELKLVLLFILLVPGLYAMYSVKRYFGLGRAAGADHFEIMNQSNTLEKRGIFKYTNNGMYVYAFLLFWAIGLIFSSKAALVIALFSHIYIWVHYYSTERPDMEYIYGVSTKRSKGS